MLFLSLAEQRQRQEDGHQKLTVRTHTRAHAPSWIKRSSLRRRFYSYCNLKIYRLVMHFEDYRRTSTALPGLFTELHETFLFIDFLYCFTETLIFVFSNMIETLLKSLTMLLKGFCIRITTMRNLSETFYCTDSVALRSESKEPTAHDRKNTQNLWKTNLYSSKAVCY